MQGSRNGLHMQSAAKMNCYLQCDYFKLQVMSITKNIPPPIEFQATYKVFESVNSLHPDSAFRLESLVENQQILEGQEFKVFFTTIVTMVRFDNS